MKAFVTGPTGFLGINLLQQLAKEGWDILAFHRSTSDLAQVKKIRGIQYAVGDVRDLDSVLRGLPFGVDAIFHTAGSVGFLLPEEEKSQYEELLELWTRDSDRSSKNKNPPSIRGGRMCKLRNEPNKCFVCNATEPCISVTGGKR